MTTGGAHEHNISDINQLQQELDDYSGSLSDLARATTEALELLAVGVQENEKRATAAEAEIEKLKAAVQELQQSGGGGNGGTPGPTPWQPLFPGDVEPGTIRWGCSYTSNGVPEPHETAAGVPVGVRRTFWRLDQMSKIIATCKDDVAAGRTPWVSIKLGTSWQNTANGAIDTQLNNFFTALGTVPGPVWFTAHHEPEGGNGTPYPDEGQGSEVHWRNMQEKIRNLLDASGVSNVAFASIIMAWTFDRRSGRNPDDWWVDGIWDFVGVDHYVDAGATSVITPMWENALAFYKDKGMKIGIAEWGNKDHSGTGAAEMQEWYDHLRAEGVVGACYFDTSLNGGVPLSGAVLEKFRELMQAPTSVTL